VTNMFEMFKDASAFAQDLSSWDVSNVGSFEGVFRSTQSDFDYSTWQLHSATSLRRAWLGNVISAANVSACLISWEADPLTATGVDAFECFSGITMSETTYSTAKTAFDNLILAVGSGGKGWDLTGAINWVA
jgi:surface protein